MLNIYVPAKIKEKMLANVMIAHLFDTGLYDKVLYIDWLIHAKKFVSSTFVPIAENHGAIAQTGRYNRLKG